MAVPVIPNVFAGLAGAPISELDANFAYLLGLMGGGAPQILFWGTLLDFTLTTDQALTVSPQLPAKYQITDAIAYNPSTSLAASAAAGGIYTGPGKTGISVVPAAETYVSLSGVAGANSLKILDLSAGVLEQVFTAAAMFFALTSGNVGAATASVVIKGIPLP